MTIRYFIELIAALVGVAAVGLGVSMLFHQKTKSYGRTFSYAILFAGGWMLAVYFADISTNLAELIWWTKVASILALIYVFWFLVFAYEFRSDKQSVVFRLLAALPILVNAIYLYSFPMDAVYVSNPFIEFSFDRPVGGILSGKFSFYLLLFLMYYLAGYLVLFHGYRKFAARKRIQTLYIGVGMTSSILAAGLFDIALPLYGIDWLYALGPACTSLLLVLTGYAIIKHRLFDIRIIIQRALIYSALLVLIAGCYIGLLFLGGQLLRETSGATISVSAGITTIIGIFTVPILDRYLRKITDQWFFKDRYDYALALQTLSTSLNDNLHMEDLLRAILQDIKSIFKISEASIWVKDQNLSANVGQGSYADNPELLEQIFSSLKESTQIMHGSDLKTNIKTLNENNISLIVGIATPEKLIGFMVLGEKNSGDSYNQQDKQLLETFAHQAAVAIEKAILYEQIKHRAQELEEAVHIRTEELHRAHETQSRLVIDMAHALQSPLTIMKSELQAVKDNASSTQIKILEKSTDEVSKRIYDLLRLARMEVQAETFSFAPVNLSKLVESIIEYVTVVCEQHNIKLESDIRPNVFVWGDQAKLEELIQNLLSNAIKYIANERLIRVELRDEGAVTLRIRDTGTGMTADALPHIFERFYRANRDPSRSGLGVGLAICKTIIERHGGTIEVESQERQGSEFIVRLQRHKNSVDGQNA